MIDSTLLLSAALLLSLTAYALLGGADYGGGVWDLLASGRTAERQRATIARAIGPVWEANHVWLIAAIVILFTGFPRAFAAVSTFLHIPLVLVLIGIVLRGSAFVFRAYGPERHDWIWGRVFAVASVATPLFLGVIVGAITEGKLPATPARIVHRRLHRALADAVLIGRRCIRARAVRQPGGGVPHPRGSTMPTSVPRFAGELSPRASPSRRWRRSCSPWLNPMCAPG